MWRIWKSSSEDGEEGVMIIVGVAPVFSDICGNSKTKMTISKMETHQAKNTYAATLWGSPEGASPEPCESEATGWALYKGVPLDIVVPGLRGMQAAKHAYRVDRPSLSFGEGNLRGKRGKRVVHCGRGCLTRRFERGARIAKTERLALASKAGGRRTMRVGSSPRPGTSVTGAELA